MTRVATIGECMIELRHTDAQTLKLGFGGDTLNTAVYLARLGRDAGMHVDYVTALGDDAYELFINGRRVGEGESLRRLDKHDITDYLQKGTNVVAIKVTNRNGPTAALAARVAVKQRAG